MFLFYVLSFFKKGNTIQGETLFKGGHYLRKYGSFLDLVKVASVYSVFYKCLNISNPFQNRSLIQDKYSLKLE